MNKIIVFLIILSSSIFAQNAKIGNELNQIETYKYVLEHLDEIKNLNNEDFLYVKLSFNEKRFIEKATYYSCNFQNKEEENKVETKVSYELDEFIKKSFSFFMNDVFFKSGLGGINYSFYIPLSKNNLKIAIDEIKDFQNLIDNKIDKRGIQTNSKFNFDLRNVYYSLQKHSNKFIESKLIFFNSELIEIAPNLYFVFRILKTNQFNTNNVVDYFEYKIMLLDGVRSRLLASNRVTMDDYYKIEISEIEVQAGNDNLSDLESYDSENGEYRIKKSHFSDDLKFELNIEFEKQF